MATHTIAATAVIFAISSVVLAAAPPPTLSRKPTSSTPALIAAAPTAKTAVFKKVLMIVLENTSYETALKQPFLASLAQRGALLTHFTAETHPSQPNYIALISGSTHGVTSDDNVDLSTRNIGDLLEAKGRQWKVYAEHYPENCFLGEESGAYVRKHVPFLSFKNVQTNSESCARIVEASKLSNDIENGTLPDYSLYIPDTKNDGHDTNVSDADRWLSSTFGPLLQNPKFTKDLLLVVTFDEDKHFLFFPSSNHIATILIGDTVTPGGTSDAALNHYSLLRLVEDEFGLGTLGQNDTRAAVITGIWK